MRGRILFADNIKRFVKVRSEFLEAAGFEVLPAYSVEEAEHILKNEWIHLAILDIRLTDDDDDLDQSGLLLAKQKAYSQIPKIILTGFPTYEAVREALGPDIEGLSSAVAFLAKPEGAKVFIKTVEETFEQHVHLNWDLVINWNRQVPLSFPYLVTLIDSSIMHNCLAEYTTELEDLFRKLFYTYTQITINHLIAHNDGRIFLTVYAYTENKAEGQFIVACGIKKAIHAENIAYETFAPQANQQSRIIKQYQQETTHFSASAYTLIDSNLEEIITFTDFYRYHSADGVKNTLHHLFNTTLAPWYSRACFYDETLNLKTFFLKEHYVKQNAHWTKSLTNLCTQLCEEALSVGIAEVKYDSGHLVFYQPDTSPAFYPDPLSLLNEKDKLFDLPVSCGVIHGQLTTQNILADLTRQTWLINFNQATQGPLLCDFVSLETSIKFNLLADLNLVTRYNLEQKLNAVSTLGEDLLTQNMLDAEHKMIVAITYIRQMAVSRGINLKNYQIGLFFYALYHLTQYNPKIKHTRRSLIIYLHCLLSAAMLCRMLRQVSNTSNKLPQQALDSLWVDEANKGVWVEGEEVKLSSGEYDLLLVLYRHANQLCTRELICQQLHGVSYDRGMEPSINSSISRLRRKIETEKRNNTYIENIRGTGYKLNLSYNPSC